VSSVRALPPTGSGDQGRYRVAILGGSGYAGGEFLRLALAHPDLEVVQVTSERYAGWPVGAVHPNLRGVCDLRFVSADALEPADVLVSALPHGTLANRIDTVLPLAPHLIDLSSDFRFRDPALYARTYAEPHPRPELLDSFVYALPERRREELRSARRIAGAGCIATAATLALAPLVDAGAITRSDVVVEAKVGSSAAGHSPNLASHHPERAGVVRTYAATGHRHGPEIEQSLPGGVRVHLSASAVERVRGILVTAHVWLHDGSSERDVRAAFQDAYADEPFVRLITQRSGIHRVPDPKILDGTNWCDIGWSLDADSGRVVVMAAIDNLVKGTAGHAIQALNLALGRDERSGLSFSGLHP